MIYKKVLGTLALTLFIVGASLTAFNFVDAQFINTKNNLDFDGLVSTVTSSVIVLQTSGTDPITVYLDKKTNYVGALKLADIKAGDHLKVNANTNNGLLSAKTIKLIKRGVGYGTTGNETNILKAVLVSKNLSEKTITVNNGFTLITFEINFSTKFDGTTFDKLKVGDNLHITGADSGDHFIAEKVIQNK